MLGKIEDKEAQSKLGLMFRGLLEEVGLGWRFPQELERWKRDLGTYSLGLVEWDSPRPLKLVKNEQPRKKQACLSGSSKE